MPIALSPISPLSTSSGPCTVVYGVESGKMKSGVGCVRVITSVASSGASIEATCRKYERCGLPVSEYRSYEYFTSPATNSRPFTGAMLWNFTPGRRWNVYVSPSSDISQASASSGTSSLRA